MRWLFAKLYDRMARGNEDAGLRAWRRDLLAEARGDVLELGAGTGLNLSHYPRTHGRLQRLPTAGLIVSNNGKAKETPEARRNVRRFSVKFIFDLQRIRQGF